MVKIVILGSCRHSPYEILLVPNPLLSSYTPDKHSLYNTEEGYINACKVFYPAIDKADLILVYAPDGIGEHTKRDIDYSISKNKRVHFIPTTAEDDYY